MKRKIASRKLKRTCIYCNSSFKKGDVYYLKRVVFKESDKIFSYEYLVCPRCKYDNERKAERRKIFVKSGRCNHPMTDTVWVTMSGEDYVKEPSHTECIICGKYV